jgi:DNA adenine methylase
MPNYPGGKNANGVYQTIINHFPPHVIYVELFMGSGAIIRNKKPAKFNIGVEIDKAVIDKFHRKTKYDVANESVFAFIKRPYRHLFHKNCLVYIDPPYIESSRRSKNNIYKHELKNIEEHIPLLRWALRTKAMVVISAYQNEIYDTVLKGWRREEYTAVLRSGETVTESLYMNFEKPTTLHEYTYLGEDCWDRQRIKRKLTLITRKLKALPPYEREAIMQAVAAVHT